MNDREAHAFVEAWVRWCATRRFFVKPQAMNALARMQPSRVKDPPDARMDAEIAWFNMAVHALIDMKDPDADAFLRYYVERISNIKKVAADMGVARSTFYVKVRRFVRRALSMSKSLASADRQMRAPGRKAAVSGPDETTNC